jgi:hypothetical protein
VSQAENIEKDLRPPRYAFAAESYPPTRIAGFRAQRQVAGQHVDRLARFSYAQSQGSEGARADVDESRLLVTP